MADQEPDFIAKARQYISRANSPDHGHYRESVVLLAQATAMLAVAQAIVYHADAMKKSAASDAEKG